MRAPIQLLVLILSFLVALPWGSLVLGLLRKWRVGKNIREDEPESHEAKQGTPTMGGIIFLAPLLVVGVAVLLLVDVSIWPALLATVGFALIGLFDDISGLRDTTGMGWKASTKFPVQIIVGLMTAAGLYWGQGIDSVHVPGLSGDLYLGLWLVPLAAVIIAWSANAVNLTDGMDGLAGGTMWLALAAYTILSYANGERVLALLCLVLMGALMAFLWYNVNPAKVFMGDVGSLALGAFLATVAFLAGEAIVLPLVALVFLAETLSVIAQVAYFKITRRRYGEGRRVFRMAPLHYHFELGGWSEVQVTQRFWIVAALGSIAAVAIGLV